MADEELQRELEAAKKELRQLEERRRQQQEAQKQAQQQQRPRVMTARRPGPIGRVAERVGSAVSKIHAPRLDARTFLIGLLIVIAFILLAENWAPVRINILGLYIDVPKAVAFVVNVAIGMLILWLWQRHAAAARAPREAEQQ